MIRVRVTQAQAEEYRALGADDWLRAQLWASIRRRARTALR